MERISQNVGDDYQGEEIGMTDPKFTDIRDYRDVESLNMYRILLEQGKSEQEVMEMVILIFVDFARRK
ncbi:Trehalose-6-phosphate hydrolase [Geobacillus stearothermophilus]|uniref:Trehalose-6-phosphate hydrolase n=1 Tax=Geobacillus stearothermophilus TaxID=1422 RepID=A0ABQ7HHF9_GEOSE|nr:Trehalose-6-phosphate hydrolase [Geobacillus stearothermophilus]KMY61168.1 hypothetical protein AA906_04440 [Geobacillus stearothermophilus]KOR93662.1 hypothetical protein N231_11275 [Geobacillus stearothermophilus ATCC 12980]OAO81595.1 Trehalose-6-phosphate hydrolase [Geobacillus stearothermophilus]